MSNGLRAKSPPEPDREVFLTWFLFICSRKVNYLLWGKQCSRLKKRIETLLLIWLYEPVMQLFLTVFVPLLEKDRRNYLIYSLWN